MFSKFSKFSDFKSIFILIFKSLLSNSLSNESFSDESVFSLFLGNLVWLLLNSCARRSLNIFLKILCESKRVFSVSFILFVEIDFVSALKSSSWINENS